MLDGGKRGIDFRFPVQRGMGLTFDYDDVRSTIDSSSVDRAQGSWSDSSLLLGLINPLLGPDFIMRTKKR